MSLKMACWEQPMAAEALPCAHAHPPVLRSSQRHQSQQEPLQEPADKQAHATSGSAGNLEDVAPFTASSEALGSQGKHPKDLHGRAPPLPPSANVDMGGLPPC